ncbi:threonine synthase [bacterium]|nr:threonine synthase [bacterium]
MLEAKYICSECGKEFPITSENMVCDLCSREQLPNKPLKGILDVKMVFPKAFSAKSIWDFLPIESAFLPEIPVGDTPLWQPSILNEETGFERLFLKNDSLNPTGSLKDRASYLVAGFARKFGLKDISVASTGNAGSSMAGIGASAGLSVTVFVPKKAPEAKLVQALQYGARVIRVDGNYDRAFELSLEYSRITGSLCRNTAFNPMTIEGKKTVAIECFFQLGRAPDVLFVPVGDGVILSGVYKGFEDLISCGIMNKMPMIYAIQAEGSDAISRASESGDFDEFKPSTTVADSICVDAPRAGLRALSYLIKHRGVCVRVSDEEILSAQHELARKTGVFAEPAASASFAGFLKIKDRLDKSETVVLLITGNGLKDIDSAQRIVEFGIEPITSIEEIV